MRRRGGWGGHSQTLEVTRAESTSGLPAWEASPGPVPLADEQGTGTGLLLPTLAGFSAMVMIGVGVVFAGSPYDLNQPGAWMFGMGHHSVHAREAGVAGVYAGLALLIAAWCRLVLYLRRTPETPVRTVAIVFALWAVPAIVAPPMFSRDIYSYAADGQMAATGINPYLQGPDALEFMDPQVVNLVDPIWRPTPTPYGPLSVGLDAGIVEATNHHEVAAIEAMRLLALGGVVLAAALLPGLARQWGTPASMAVALAALNPLTLLGIISPGHNDALMVGLVVAALALAARSRRVLALAVCGLAAAVKSPALIVTAFIAWDWAGHENGWAGRIRVLSVAALVTLGMLEAMSLTTGLGWGWLHTIGTAGLVRSVLSPTTDVAFLSEQMVHLFRHGPATVTLIALARGAGYLLVAGLTAWLLWRRERVGALVALALSLFLLVALGPVYQPWYLVWGLFCLAPVAVGRWWILAVAASIFGTVTVLPRFEPLVASAGVAGDFFGLVAFGVLAVLCSQRAEARINRLGWFLVQRDMSDIA
jgi:alpha-1,6-mannosyltransferase